MFASSQLVRDMVQEKQDKIKAAMKMMGVTGIHHWTAWFFRGLLSIGLALVVVTFVSVGLKLFPVDGSILLIFFLLAGISIIAQTFVVSTLFNKATNAAFCAGFGESFCCQLRSARKLTRCCRNVLDAAPVSVWCFPTSRIGSADPDLEPT